MKLKYIQTNFRGGEIDPKLKGLTETGRYKGGLDTCLNAYIGITGFVSRRPGTEFVSDSGDLDVKFIPFKIFRTDLSSPKLQDYLVEFRSDNTVHFYTEGAYISSSSIASPLIDGDVSLIRYEQFDNVLYLVHPDFAPTRLIRTSDTSWTFDDINFIMDLSDSVSGADITRSGSTVRVRLGLHGYKIGWAIKIVNADQSEYNGEFVITDIDPVSLYYEITGTPSSPATGIQISVRRVYWSTLGYPSAITFFEQRLLLSGVATSPQTVFGSESGNISNMRADVGDSDPFEFVLQAATSAIIHLSAIDKIFVSTRDKELSLEGGVAEPLTPTNVVIKEKGRRGTIDNVRPLIINEEVIFPTRHSIKLRALSYQFEKDKFDSPDLSIYSGHLSALGIKDMAYQDEPNSIIWIITDTGKLLSLTLDRDEEIIAWASHTTDGLFKNVEVISYQSKYQVWVAVERIVNGITSTYIETLTPALNTDAAFIGSDVTAKSLWNTGLAHLEGKTVDILADGIVMRQDVVVSGAITLPRVANNVEIGLHYETVIKDLPPEIGTAIGTAQGQAVSVHEAYVRLYESVGCEVNGDEIPFRKFGADLLDEVIEPFTGDKFISLIGWEGGVVEIKQVQPLPFTVLAITKGLTINGG